MHRGLVGLVACGAIVGAALATKAAVDIYDEYRRNNDTKGKPDNSNDSERNNGYATIHISINKVENPEEKASKTKAPEFKASEGPKAEEPKAEEPKAPEEPKRPEETKASEVPEEADTGEVKAEVEKLIGRATEVLKKAAADIKDPEKVAEVAGKATEKFNKVISDVTITAHAVADTVITDEVKEKLNKAKLTGYEVTDKMLEKLLGTNKDNKDNK